MLLIGGTGTVGSQVVSLLAGRDDVCALAHTDASARVLDKRGIATVRGDLADPATLGHAFAGASRVLLVTPFSPQQTAPETNPLEAAQPPGVSPPPPPPPTHSPSPSQPAPTPPLTTP